MYVCMSLCVRMHVCVVVHICMPIQRPVEIISWPPLSVYSYSFEVESLP